MKRETKLKFSINISNESFEVLVTVPSLDVMDQIADIFEPIKKERQAGFAASITPEMRSMLKGVMQGSADHQSIKEALLANDAINIGDMLVKAKSITMKRSDRTTVSKLIEPFVEGLPEDLDENVKRNALFEIAEEVHEYVENQVSGIEIKN